MVAWLSWTKAFCFLFVLAVPDVTSFALSPLLQRVFRWKTTTPKQNNDVSLVSPKIAARPSVFALLVDAENASSSSFDLAMQDIQKRGIETPIRRIFGKTAMLKQRHWQGIIQKHSFIPIFCQGLVDMDLALDAMDILYTKEFVRGFVLFTSDADFTRLVQRIRENNLTVLGFGQRYKTNFEQNLPNACHEFVYTEDLVQAAIQEACKSAVTLRKDEDLVLNDNNAYAVDEEAIDSQDLSVLDQKYATMKRNGIADPEATASVRLVVQTLKNDLKALSPQNEWVYLSALTSRSLCDLKDTGYTKMSKFVQAQRDEFEVRLDGTSFKIRLRD